MQYNPRAIYAYLLHLKDLPAGLECMTNVIFPNLKYFLDVECPIRGLSFGSVYPNSLKLTEAEISFYTFLIPSTYCLKKSLIPER